MTDAASEQNPADEDKRRIIEDAIMAFRPEVVRDFPRDPRAEPGPALAALAAAATVRRLTKHRRLIDGFRRSPPDGRASLNDVARRVLQSTLEPGLPDDRRQVLVDRAKRRLDEVAAAPGEPRLQRPHWQLWVQSTDDIFGFTTHEQTFEACDDEQLVTKAAPEGELVPSRLTVAQFWSDLPPAAFRPYIDPRNWPTCCPFWMSIVSLGPEMPTTDGYDWDFEETVSIITQTLTVPLHIEFRELPDRSRLWTQFDISRDFYLPTTEVDVDSGTVSAESVPDGPAPTLVKAIKYLHWRDPNRPDPTALACEFGWCELLEEMAYGCAQGFPAVPEQAEDFIRSGIPPERKRQQDQVEWQSDSPAGASADLLNRRPLAEALATRLRRFHDEDPDTSFLMHIDGAWGTGKSTLINLLRSELAEDWLTVDFDAWRESRIGPPWWALLAAVRHDLRSGLTSPRRMWLRLAESWIRARRAGAPYVFALLLLLGVAVTVYILLRPSHLTFSSARDLAAAVAAAFAALGALWAGALVAGRFLLWDSARGARLFEQSNSNPMQDVADHFAWLIAQARRPTVFFVDDLDRCTETYVVDFLEAVQTLIRDATKGSGEKPRAASASFIIAADGAWIRKSYEIAYKAFESSVGEPGRPLGYLFLDKLFQLRVPVPSVDPRRQREYLSELLRVHRQEEVSQAVAAEEQSVRARLSESSTETEVVETLRSTSPTVRALVAEAAVQKLSAPEIITATEHALQRFAPLLTANPRSMKRFVNDYSILRAVRTLEGNPVRIEPLALWAIMETQWPALADYLRHRPEVITRIGDRATDLDDTPVMIQPLFSDPNVKRLITFEYGGPLTAELISSCCGAAPPSTD